MTQRLWVQRAFIAAAATAVFTTSLAGPFLKWDDGIYVTESVRTQRPHLEGLKAVWSSDDVWAGGFLEYFPLRDTVYWLTWQGFGRNPVAFHLVNIIAHACVALLVFQLARRFGLAPRTAFWGAILFAVHPIHVESVTWISALKDPMFTGLMLGSVLSFLRYRATGRPVDYGLCLTMMVAALLSKSIALATPLLMLVIDRWLEPRPRWRESLARIAGPSVIALLFLITFVLIGKLNSIVGGPHGGSWAQHYFLMAWALVRYVQQSVAPATFRVHYCFIPLDGLSDPRLLGIVFLVVGVAAALTVAWRRQRLAGVLVLWFFACLAPVANIVPFPAIMADRYLYAPSIAACLLLSWGIDRFTVTRRWVFPTVAVVFATITLLRGAIWQDLTNLLAEVVEDDACLRDDLVTAAVMYLNYADALADPKVALADPKLALANFQKGITHPAFRFLLKRNQAIYLRKGIAVALKTGDMRLARQWSDQALQVAPADPDVWANRALTVADPELALEAAQHAFRLERSADTYFLLGTARLAVNQPKGADDIVTAVDLEPNRYCPFFLIWLNEEPAKPFVDALSGLRAKCQEIAAAGSVSR